MNKKNPTNFMVVGIHHSPSANISTGLSTLALSSSCKDNTFFLFLISIFFPQLGTRLGLFNYLLQKESVFIWLPSGKFELPFLKTQFFIMKVHLSHYDEH